MKYFKSRQTQILLVIILVGLFFRIFKIDLFYIFEHDQDLYSWIVKDIWVNHHLRLIGQVTSIEGVFIGPFFYYLLTPFYALLGMTPLAASALVTVIGLITIWSIYFVFSRFFGKNVGLFGAAIYATSLGPVFFDRWAVPTNPTMLWCVWFLYTAFSLAEGKTKSLILAAILLGTVWHIHVALLPLTPLLLIAFFLSKQKLTAKIIFSSLVTLLFLTLPFWIFEYKHNFLQTKSLLFTSGNAGIVLKGMERFLKILSSTQKVLTTSLFDTWDLVPSYLTTVLTLFLFIFAALKKLLIKKQIIVIFCWIVLVITVQQVTKNPISEYYVANLTILPILFVSLFLGFLWKQKKLKYLALVAVIIYGLVNMYLLITKPEPLHLYAYKKRTIDFIKQDFIKNDYKCISISFIAKYGTAVGFRYLVWWEGMSEIKPNPQTPLYSIVIPYDAINKNELDAQFGYFGVILPEKKSYDFSNCNDPNLELIPLLGFNN